MWVCVSGWRGDDVIGPCFDHCGRCVMGFGSSLYRSLCYCADSWFPHDKVKRAVVGSPPVCTLLGGCWAPGSGSGLTRRWLSACGGALPGARGPTPCTPSVWLALPECHMPRFNVLSVFQRPWTLSRHWPRCLHCVDFCRHVVEGGHRWHAVHLPSFLLEVP